MAKPFNLPRFDFSGGINTKVSDFLRKRNEVPILVNGDIRKIGEVKVFPGFTSIGGSIAGSGTAYVYEHHELTTSTRKLLAWRSGTIYAFDGATTWTSILSGLDADAIPGFATLGDITIIGNGVDSTYQTRGTSGTTSTIAGAPLANVFAVFGQKVYGINTEATTNRNRMYWSSANDGTTWDTANDNFDIDADSPVEGIFRARGRLWNMTGSTSRVFNGLNENPEISEYGIVSPRAVAGSSNSIFGYDRQGVWGVVDGAVTIISRKIDDYISSVNPDDFDNIAMGVYDDLVFIAVGDTDGVGDAPSNDGSIYVLDTSTGNWTALGGINARSFATYVDANNTEFMAIGTSDGQVFKWPDGSAYGADGAIYFQMETGWDYADMPHVLKKASTIKIFADSGAKASVKYKLLTEKGETEWRDISGLAEYVTRKTFGMEENWYAIKLRVSQSSRTETIAFKGYVLEGETAGDR